MNTKKRFSKCMAVALAFAMTLTLMPGGFAAPREARAADRNVSIDSLSPISAIQTAIQGAIDDADGSGTVTVTGTNTGLVAGNLDVADRVRLNIPSGVTVKWTAEFQVSGDPFNLIRLNGAGVFEMESGSLTANASNGLLVSENDWEGTVKVSGGSISNNHSAGNAAISVLNANNSVEMTGGSVTMAAGSVAGSNYAIDAREFKISGDATVSATASGGTGGGGAVYCRGKAYVDGGSITSNRASSRALRATDTAYIDGGTIAVSNSTTNNQSMALDAPIVYMTGGTVRASGQSNRAVSGSKFLLAAGGTIEAVNSAQFAILLADNDSPSAAYCMGATITGEIRSSVSNSNSRTYYTGTRPPGLNMTNTIIIDAFTANTPNPAGGSPANILYVYDEDTKVSAVTVTLTNIGRLDLSNASIKVYDDEREVEGPLVTVNKIDNTETATAASTVTFGGEGGIKSEDITIVISGAKSRAGNTFGSDVTADLPNITIGPLSIFVCATHTPEADDGDCTTPIQCKICKEITTEAQASHSFTTYAGNTATCTAAGVETATCANAGCEEIDTRPTVALNHDMPAVWTTRAAATCATAGEEFMRCSRYSVCNHETTRPIAALGHNYEPYSDPANCENDGESGERCTRCSVEINVTILSKLGHSWGEWADDGDGENFTRTCARCAKTENQTIPPNGCSEHDFTGTVTMVTLATCVAEGSETVECSRCSATITQSIPTIPHSFGGWTVTTPTTPTTDGLETRRCEHCPVTETRTIYALTIRAGTGGAITTGASGPRARGAVISVAASANNNYKFDKWTSSNGGAFGNANSASTTFTMPDNATTITANFTYTGGGGGNGGGGGGGGSAKPPAAPGETTTIPGSGGASAETGDTVDIPVTVETNAGTGADAGSVTVTVNLDAETKETLIAAAIKAAEEAKADAASDEQAAAAAPTVTLDLSAVEGAVSAVLNVDTARVFADAEVVVTVILPDAEITLAPETLAALAAVTEIGTTPVTVEAAIVPMSDLRGMRAAQVKGYETVISIDVFVGDRKTDVPLLVSLPCNLKPNENPEAVRVWHLDDTGRLTKLDGAFDPATGMITFAINHQSYFVVGYDPVALWVNIFSDVAEKDWFYDAVAYANYHELFGGYGDSVFAPRDSMTRAMFATVLWNLEGNPASNGAAGFADVKPGAWYEGAVNWAAESGVVSGVGDDKFAPEKPVTRQEMAVMLYNYAAFKDYEIPENRAAPRYSDSGQISGWAEDAAKALSEAGVMSGADNAFSPKKDAARAEVAQLFKNFLRFVAEE